MSFPFEDYKIIQQIGKGGFAVVKLAVHLPTKTQVAIKVIPKSNIHDADKESKFEKEVNLIKSIDHPFVAEFFECREDDRYFYIIMEYASNGNMLDYVNNHGRLTETQARRFFIQLISVLEYLHDVVHIAHRDLKAENVLLDRNENIRLADFGLSTRFSEVCPLMKTPCGSPAYASPEIIQGQEYTTLSDIWTAGILLYAMVMGELPFEDENIQKFFHKIIYSEPKYLPTISPQLRNLLEKMLEKDPTKRITIPKIKKNPWFSQSDYAKLITEGSHISNKFTVRPSHISFIDPTIVSEMTHYGYDCQSLSIDLLNNKTTSLTAVYRMLRKEKITNLLNSNPLMSPRQDGIDPESEDLKGYQLPGLYQFRENGKTFLENVNTRPGVQLFPLRSQLKRITPTSFKVAAIINKSLVATKVRQRTINGGYVTFKT